MFIGGGMASPEMFEYAADVRWRETAGRQHFTAALRHEGQDVIGALENVTSGSNSNFVLLTRLYPFTP